jgi:hypothetical protein
LPTLPRNEETKQPAIEIIAMFADNASAAFRACSGGGSKHGRQWFLR